MIEIDFHIIETEKDGIDTSISDVKVAKTCTLRDDHLMITQLRSDIISKKHANSWKLLSSSIMINK